MLPFGDTNALTQQQIADIEAYVMKLNKVDRAMIYNPGMRPDVFFWITIVIFLLAVLAVTGFWSRRADREAAKQESK